MNDLEVEKYLKKSFVIALRPSLFDDELEFFSKISRRKRQQQSNAALYGQIITELV